MNINRVWLILSRLSVQCRDLNFLHSDPVRVLFYVCTRYWLGLVLRICVCNFVLIPRRSPRRVYYITLGEVTRPIVVFNIRPTFPILHIDFGWFKTTFIERCVILCGSSIYTITVLTEFCSTELDTSSLLNNSQFIVQQQLRFPIGGMEWNQVSCN